MNIDVMMIWKKKEYKKEMVVLLMGELEEIFLLSFGDFNMREFGLISKPYINKILVNDNEKNFLVLGEEELFYSFFNNDDSYDICK